jgi:hypothetical protein
MGPVFWDTLWVAGMLLAVFVGIALVLCLVVILGVGFLLAIFDDAGKKGGPRLPADEDD